MTDPEQLHPIQFKQVELDKKGTATASWYTKTPDGWRRFRQAGTWINDEFKPTGPVLPADTGQLRVREIGNIRSTILSNQVTEPPFIVLVRESDGAEKRFDYEWNSKTFQTEIPHEKIKIWAEVGQPLP